MQRLNVGRRSRWREAVERLGLIWHTADQRPYWNEGVYYSFSSVQIDQIEAATAELYRLYLEAGQYVIDRDLLGRLGAPDWTIPLIKRAWDEEPPALNYGRFDLGYDGRSPPKLFEFNCDTPTSLLEAAIIQWDWKEAVFPGADQFNSLHERLVAKWRDLKPYLPTELVHFAHVQDDAGEDSLTTAYLRDTAGEAGLATAAILMSDIGWNGSTFVDLELRPMRTVFKLYPWEWLAAEDFSPHIAQAATLWIEPIWKMMWSNKALLPILWELFPDHPNLLPAFLEPAGGDYVRKPMLSREGANVTIVRAGRSVIETEGDYGDGGFIYQQVYELPVFDGRRPVIGSWIVDGEPAGMGIREGGLITDNTAAFVPHIFR